MSIESDASKWKSNVSRILEVDPEGILLTETVKKYFDEVASVFKKGTFDAENTKKLLKVLRGRNTRLSGKPIAVELSSFVNITERYATKTEGVFADFAKALALSSTSPRTHQVQSSRQNPLSDSLDFSELEELDRIFSESDSPAYESPSRTLPPRTQQNPSPRLNSLTAYGRQVQLRVVDNPFAEESAEKKSRISWVIGIILLIIGAILVVNYMNDETNHSDLELEKKKENNSVVVNSNVVKGTMKDPRDGKTYKTVKIGSHVWMAENLNYITENSFCYDDDPVNCKKYGRLYTWNAAWTACPHGWFLPTKIELWSLIENAGGIKFASKALRATSGWNDFGNGDDAFGFSALPAGYRSNSGNFYSQGVYAYFWGQSRTYRAADYMYLYRGSDDASFDQGNMDFALSVRCFKESR